MKIILSIKPEYANKILDGTKKFEYRKSGFSAENIEIVLIYATKPIGKVIGEFTVECIHIDRPSKIWQKTRDWSGINKSFFDEYYRDRSVAVAIEIDKVKRYDEPIDLSDLEPGMTAPQSFRYLSGDASLSQIPLPI